MHSLRPFLPLILFGLLLLGFGLSLFRGDPSKLESNLIDQPFPEFSLTSLDDPNSQITSKDITGQISLINVFGSWCIACVQEHPNLMEIAKTDRVRVIGMNWRDTREKGRAWLDRYGDPYDLILFDADSELAISLGVTGAPETYLVDQEGSIRHKHVGIITYDIWKKDLLPRIRKLESGP